MGGLLGVGGGGGLASPLPTPMQINTLVRLNCIQLSSGGNDRLFHLIGVTLNGSLSYLRTSKP